MLGDYYLNTPCIHSRALKVLVFLIEIIFYNDNIMIEKALFKNIISYKVKYSYTSLEYKNVGNSHASENPALFIDDLSFFFFFFF